MITRFTTIILILLGFSAFGQDEIPELSVGLMNEVVIIDGSLDESSWENAPAEHDLLTTEPVEGATPTGKTVVRVIADSKAVIIGVECHYEDPSQIVSFSKLRDTRLRSEDHVRVVFDPFLDGQSGYIFAVNANGARYDALVSNRGESENSDWDAVWEAVTTRIPTGWTVEIKIPIQSISFQKGLDQWAFNIERRIEANQEVIRWANVKVDQFFLQTSRAGRLTNLPSFDYGIGLNIRPSAIADVSREGTAKTDYSFNPSIDIGQRIGPNIQSTLTINTDFAEAEVDTRRTNLTRFPLFFPERRAFFLEGSDIFEFGFGLGGHSRSLVPFFSRRIGLYSGEQIPIVLGGKVNGRVGNTSFGGLVSRTKSHTGDDFTLDAANMGVFRIKQNVFKESSVGVIGMFGDPQSRGGSFTGGADFTYQTTRLWGDKNFIAGMWGMRTQRDDLASDEYAYGFKVDYPNDLWDLSVTYMRVGDEFDPALSFVQRKGIHYARFGGIYAPRPKWKWLRQMRNFAFLSLWTDLDGNWESYSIYLSPINWQLESGDRVEFKINPKGEQFTESFEIAEGITIPAGAYEFTRWGFEVSGASKRQINGRAEWTFGQFYEGTLHEFRPSVNWNPSSLINFEFSLTRNVGRLPYGDFEQTLMGTRVRFNFTPDLQLNSFIQYDTESRQMGLNARLHWIFHPQGDLFVVYNHNTYYPLERTEFLSNQFLIKARYNFRI